MLTEWSFKAYFSRFLADTARLAPFTHDIIMPKLASSAAAAIQVCTAGDSGTQCGMKWTTGQNDGSFGVGEEMSVLEVVQSNLIDEAPAWVSEVHGTGTSQGSPNAGGGSRSNTGSLAQMKPITTADRVGAGILTALLLGSVVGAVVIMVLP